jgi:hypothetical protein
MGTAYLKVTAVMPFYPLRILSSKLLKMVAARHCIGKIRRIPKLLIAKNMKIVVANFSHYRTPYIWLSIRLRIPGQRWIWELNAEKYHLKPCRELVIVSYQRLMLEILVLAYIFR